MAPLDLSAVHWQTELIFQCLFEDDEGSIRFRQQCHSDLEHDGPGDNDGWLRLCLFLFCTHPQPSLFGVILLCPISCNRRKRFHFCKTNGEAAAAVGKSLIRLCGIFAKFYTVSKHVGWVELSRERDFYWMLTCTESTPLYVAPKHQLNIDPDVQILSSLTLKQTKELKKQTKV